MDKLEEKLEQFSAEYKKRLKEAYIYANSDFRSENIELLQALDNEARQALFRYTESRVRQRTMALSYTTTILTICYLIAISYIWLDMQGDEFTLVAIALSALGTLSLFSLLITFIPFKSKKRYSTQIKYELIKTWNELESISTDLKNTKGTGRYLSPKRILIDIGALSPEEENDIIHLLTLRNKIVHSSDENISDKDIIDTTNSAKKIISHLRNQ